MPTKRYRIRWAPIAIRDLDDILIYISVEDFAEAASKVYLKIKDRTVALSSFPKRCRVVPELCDIGIMEYRELIVAPYRVFFRISQNVVNIVGVLDGRRDLEEIILKRILEE